MLMSALVVLFAMCNKAKDLPATAFDDRLSGGLATVFDETSHAFANSINSLSGRDEVVHEFGDPILPLRAVSGARCRYGAWVCLKRPTAFHITCTMVAPAP